MATMPQCGAPRPRAQQVRGCLDALDARSARQPTRDATAVRRVYPYPDRVGTHGGRSDRPAETRNADRRRARRTGRTAGRARRVPLCAVAAAPRPPRPACTHAPPGLSPPQTRCLFYATPRAVRREIKRDLAARPRRIRCERYCDPGSPLRVPLSSSTAWLLAACTPVPPPTRCPLSLDLGRLRGDRCSSRSNLLLEIHSHSISAGFEATGAPVASASSSAAG